MVYKHEAVLEGVSPVKMISLRSLALGRNPPGTGAMAQLMAKGWVEMAGDVALITLAGRTLLDHPPVGYAAMDGQG